MGHRYLNFLTFNVRSLIDTSRRIDLLNTLKCNNIDIAFIQECHLRRNRNVVLNGYNFLYDNSSIGVAIVIKNSISYNRLEIDGIGFHGSYIEIQLNINGIRKKFLIGSLYFPCNYGPRLQVDLDKILHIANNFDGFVFGGDLNAKNSVWGDFTDNCNGKVLNDWLQDHSYDVVRLCDNGPSFPLGSSFLDHFLIDSRITNSEFQNYNISSLPSFSDHFPLKLKLQLNTNWDHFKQDMVFSSLSIMPPVDRNLQNYEIDQVINEFVAIFNSVHNSHSEKIVL